MQLVIFLFDCPAPFRRLKCKQCVQVAAWKSPEGNSKDAEMTPEPVDRGSVLLRNAFSPGGGVRQGVTLGVGRWRWILESNRCLDGLLARCLESTQQGWSPPVH